jgi:hypothetical protein
MTWKYGLVKTYYAETDEYEYGVHEIFDIDGGQSWTKEPVTFFGLNRDEVEKALSNALLDISRESDEEIEARGE